jgi:hypothetical protein
MMFRPLAHLDPSAGHQDPRDQTLSSASAEPGRVRASQPRPVDAPPKSVAPEVHARRANPIDFNLSFRLLGQAISRFSDPKPDAGQVIVEAHLIEELWRRLMAYQTERTQLQSAVADAEARRRTALERCAKLEAELDRLKGRESIRPAFNANLKRGVS